MRAQLFPLAAGCWLAGFALQTVTAPAQPATAVFTNAAQVRALTSSEAARARPVHLRGVVLDGSSPVDRSVVLADPSADIYLLAETNLFRGVHRTDVLDVVGVTDPGEFAPIVKVSAIQIIGSSPVPAPRPVFFQDLLTGALDGQWVEISGVLRRAIIPTNAPGISRLYLAANGGILSVRVPGRLDSRLQVDAEVRVRAVCFYQFNRRRQVLTPVLQVPEGVPVLVEKDAPAQPFEAPLRSAIGLLQFSADGIFGHRVHVRGVVTHAEPGSRVWIRDGNSGLRVHTVQNEDLKPGDQIEILGFPGYGSPSPLLEDAVFRKTGSGPPPEPRRVEGTNAMNFEDDLVSVEASIADVQRTLEGISLTLKSGSMDFKALLKGAPEARVPPGWETGSKVRVAGICSVTHDDVRPLMGIWQPQSFQILMRSAGDLTVLQRPLWWTPSHLIFVLGGVIGILVLATGAVMWVARGRLKEQGRQRTMAEAEFAAILAERNRLAREIHDTLSQGLVATSVQLRLAKKQSSGAGPALQTHLETAQQLVRQSLQEARNSIWNMRSQVLEHDDLAGALSGILAQMTKDTGVRTRFEVRGQSRRLAPVIENNLLRVGQEAITNAVRHAGASQVDVAMEFADLEFQLIVADDGRGFDPGKAVPATGGFGLVGMRERVVEMQGALQIHSAPGEGSRIKLIIPLASESPGFDSTHL